MSRAPSSPWRAPRARPVLVVLPVLTWQGRNDVDDNGDGLPDSLARERRRASSGRSPAGGCRSGSRASEAKLLAYLDRQGLRYELTTDLRSGARRRRAARRTTRA